MKSSAWVVNAETIMHTKKNVKVEKYLTMLILYFETDVNTVSFKYHLPSLSSFVHLTQ